MRLILLILRGVSGYSPENAAMSSNDLDIVA